MPAFLSFLLTMLSSARTQTQTSIASLSARVDHPTRTRVFPLSFPPGLDPSSTSGYPLLVVVSSLFIQVETQIVSLLGVDTQSGISTNPAHPTITVQAPFAPHELRL